MQELWSGYGFYLWLLTTGLVLIALVWLAWNTFGPGNAEPETREEEIEIPKLDELETSLTRLSETMPYIQATLGRTFQFYGLERYPDSMGAQAFALTVASGRGDGFVLASSVRGGVSLKLLTDWKANQPLTPEEQASVDQAQQQKGQRA